ncbi:MAG: DUF423 domain-containing protein [Porticoccaceae bacterium]|nr:DUF423 domain-containing protein [Porticoccaceae bacterium]MDG1473270.1 DUF423 domain-containing protein [Porticoccaceae bacterium]
MNNLFWLKFISLSGALAVMLGAFAAHGLDDSLSDTYMATFRTAVLYHFLHTLALLAVICLPVNLVKSHLRPLIAVSFAAGIVVFCGSLYALVLLDVPAMGMITPLGGVAFIVGWLLLFFAARRPE